MKPLLFASYNMMERYSNALRVRATDYGDVIGTGTKETTIERQINELIM